MSVYAAIRALRMLYRDSLNFCLDITHLLETTKTNLILSKVKNLKIISEKISDTIIAKIFLFLTRSQGELWHHLGECFRLSQEYRIPF